MFSSHVSSQALAFHGQCHFPSSLAGMGTDTVPMWISNLTSIGVQERKHVSARFTTLELRSARSRKDHLPVVFGFDMRPLHGEGIQWILTVEESYGVLREALQKS